MVVSFVEMLNDLRMVDKEWMSEKEKACNSLSIRANENNSSATKQVLTDYPSRRLEMSHLLFVEVLGLEVAVMDSE